MKRRTMSNIKYNPPGRPTDDEYAHFKRLREDPAYRLACRLDELEDQMLPSLGSLNPLPEEPPEPPAMPMFRPEVEPPPRPRSPRPRPKFTGGIEL